MSEPVRMLDGQFLLQGKVAENEPKSIVVTSTDALGRTASSSVEAKSGLFELPWPAAFEPKIPFIAGPLYLSASLENSPEAGSQIMLILLDDADQKVDLPQVFCDDFLSSDGKADKFAPTWGRNRSLANHFMRSRAAKIAGIGSADFDLDKNDDFIFFKDHLSIYDFDHRDRDWSKAVGERPAQGFLQAVWDGWFNQSNNHPWDGNLENRAAGNFHPYTFTNDLADMLVLFQLLDDSNPSLGDHRKQLRDGLLDNLLALQNTENESFCLPSESRKAEIYTRGAFRYGLFETGEWLTEGKGWFANPERNDFADGGVFNGRAMWALGESLRANPDGKRREKIQSAIQSLLRFCFYDGQSLGYTELTASGHPF